MHHIINDNGFSQINTTTQTTPGISHRGLTVFIICAISPSLLHRILHRLFQQKPRAEIPHLNIVFFLFSILLPTQSSDNPTGYGLRNFLQELISVPPVADIAGKFCQQDSAGYIDQHMLSERQRRYKYQYSDKLRYPFIPLRNAVASTQTNAAHPTHQTMDRRNRSAVASHWYSALTACVQISWPISPVWYWSSEIPQISPDRLVWNRYPL